MNNNIIIHLYRMSSPVLIKMMKIKIAKKIQRKENLEILKNSDFNRRIKKEKKKNMINIVAFSYGLISKNRLSCTI